MAWLVERFDPFLFAAARYHLAGRLGRLSDPGDLTHEVWAVALRRMSDLEFDPASSTRGFLAFLSSTLRNLVNNLVRKQIRHGTLGGGVRGARTESSRPDVLDGIPADITDVTSRARLSELRGTVIATLDELEPTDREIIVLRAIEQVSNREVAVLLGVEPGTVSVRYHRALKRLRRALPGSILEEVDAD